MTEEELKNKCKERTKIFQQAMESCKSSSPMDCIEWFADRIAELEAQIEEMKNWCNCKNYQQCLIELAEQGRGMKPSECCVNCKKWEIKEK